MTISKWAIAVLLVCTLAVLSPAAVFAHETKVIGSLSILFHSEPEDNPIAREPARMYFFFKDSASRFKTNLCDCRLTISRDGNTLSAQNLTASAGAEYGSDVLVADYVFPEKAVYLLTLTGNAPKNQFPPFNLTYTLRIEREPDATLSPTPSPSIGPPPASPVGINPVFLWTGGIGILLIAVFTVIFRSYK